QGASQYADLVRTVRSNRCAAGMRETNWVVVRNRIASIANRNQRHVAAGLQELSAMLDFRVASGITERIIFRELFPTGVTVFDMLDRKVLGVEPTMSHVAARREIRELLDRLDLPPRLRAPVTAGAVVGAAAAAAAQ
ncbi:MAG: division plane positioning ATPase MipZ, partial [Bauldia sp.]